jgi:RNA 3'-phosphate cyclase
MTIEVDGGQGEGGGQILRTAVALAAVTKKDVVITNIRAGRPRPGLAPQHLAAVRGVGMTCDACIEGDEIGSTELRFSPGLVKGGLFKIDVGTAGSVTLVLQACMLALCHSPERFKIQVQGGTDVAHAPPLDHYRLVLIPMLKRMGYCLELHLERRGFYPEGGGMVSLEGSGRSVFTPCALKQPGRFLSISGVAFAQNLPEHVASRMAMECKKVLVGHQPVQMRVENSKGPSTGAGVELAALYENTLLGASKMGERGLMSERVAQIACENLQNEMAGATLDRFTADQLLPYMAMADGPSEFKVSEVTDHLTTQMRLLSQFLPVCCEMDGAGPTTITVVPSRT